MWIKQYFSIPLITSFTEALVDEGEYVMIKLCSVTLPFSLQGISVYIDELDKYLDVFKTLRSILTALDPTFWETARRRDTLDISAFRASLHKTNSDSRRCFVHVIFPFHDIRPKSKELSI
ncbi:hypothetical protein VTP01DRAFT_4596 [Rhizomucor pusillus]|uniref:uncharacterized protein n=1 Tax=Rhizomucor pusillus TaxID=4840 RepID=UPI00374229A7